MPMTESQLNVRHDVTVVVFNANDREILFERRDQCSLPRVPLDGTINVIRAVSKALRRRFGVSVFVLRSMEYPDGGLICVARVALVHRARPEGWEWADAGQARHRMIPEHIEILDFALKQQEIHDACDEPHLSRFSELDRLRDWYLPVLEARGWHELEIEHWQLERDATVLRITTTGQTVWLKTVGIEHRTEPSISRGLAEMRPDDFPSVLASDQRWNAMLLEGIEGPTLNEIDDRKAWLLTAERLAELQIRFVGHENELLAIGCADLRCPRLIDQIPEFFRTMIPIMQAQQSNRQPACTVDELYSLADQAERICRALSDLSIPDTLVHGNFSPHNVIWRDETPVFIDWAFALVGFPLISEDYFRHRMQREHPEFAVWSKDLHAAYYKPWERDLGTKSLAPARTSARILAPLVAAMNLHAQAPEAWRSVPMRAPALRSLVRKFARELSSQSGFEVRYAEA